MKLYLAGPLFSEGERDWMVKLKVQINCLAAEQHRDIQVIWPYELATQEEINAWGENRPSTKSSPVAEPILRTLT